MTDEVITNHLKISTKRRNLLIPHVKIEAHPVAKHDCRAFLIPANLVPGAVGGMIRNHFKIPAEIWGQVTWPAPTTNSSDVGAFVISRNNPRVLPLRRV